MILLAQRKFQNVLDVSLTRDIKLGEVMHTQVSVKHLDGKYVTDALRYNSQTRFFYHDKKLPSL